MFNYSGTINKKTISYLIATNSSKAYYISIIYDYDIPLISNNYITINSQDCHICYYFF